MSRPAAPGGRGAAASAEEINFGFAWIPYGKHAFFYGAREKGFYAKEGFSSVKFVPGRGGMDAIKKIAAGQTDYGLGGIDVLVVARAKGTKIKPLGVWHDKGFLVVYYLKESGIKVPKDLEGRSIGSPSWQDSRVLFPALAQKAGVDTAKVRWVEMPPPAQGSSLMARKVDAVASFSILDPIYGGMAAKQGNTLGAFYFADYGIDLYSNDLLATEARIRNNSGKVKRFVRATYKGISWAVEHPKEALSIFLKANPASSKVIAKAQFKIAMDHLMTKTAVEKGVGYITKKKMRVTRDMVSKYKRLKTTVPIDDLYTLKYLPKLFPKRGTL
ncbi:MAG: ABC transporter substrate-binding protein [Nitrospinota bacterium]|nr:ABC transporter substrate-binding protein [Nitrospinota bacterium]